MWNKFYSTINNKTYYLKAAINTSKYRLIRKFISSVAQISQVSVPHPVYWALERSYCRFNWLTCGVIVESKSNGINNNTEIDKFRKRC